MDKFFFSNLISKYSWTIFQPIIIPKVNVNISTIVFSVVNKIVYFSMKFFFIIIWNSYPLYK